ncbi:MAG: pantoate--beta-alanine ligase [Myxococcales bacterium]|jgi:pantoate--beta-alanine ligase|nr:pantoate--beta-alanine ligase [Myxococcales bacterium]
MLEIARTAAEVRAFRKRIEAEGKTLALVPTMGALHEGHLSLFREARARADVCAASLFVNPTQFGPTEDLSRYPRDEAGDFAKMEQEGVSFVFAPKDAEVLYPEGEETRVEVAALSTRLCGASRPGHFKGVATVVLKLFNLVQPHVAVFGEKDFQQLQIIRRMVRDLFLDIEIVGAPLVRESTGLALSSRNAYLQGEDRERALGLTRCLQAMRAAAVSGDARGSQALIELGRGVIEEHGLVLDYLDIVDPQTLQPIAEIGGTRSGQILVAAFCGKVRLIDNAPLA